MSKTTLNNLEELELQLLHIHASNMVGEEYHPGYRKFKDQYARLVRSDMETERELNKYFREASKRIIGQIDWGTFDQLKASVSDFMHVDWDAESIFMRVVLAKGLKQAIIAGGEMTELETAIDIGWSGESEPALKFIRQHVLKLSGDLTKTTKNRIIQSLLTSIELGEPRNDATARLTSVVADKKRAEMIAHTESVRAFTEGRLQVGREVGADRKQWDATLKACSICQGLDRRIVKIDEDFSAGISAPPAHPNCRCLIKLVMPKKIATVKPKKEELEALKQIKASIDNQPQPPKEMSVTVKNIDKTPTQKTIIVSNIKEAKQDSVKVSNLKDIKTLKVSNLKDIKIPKLPSKIAISNLKDIKIPQPPSIIDIKKPSWLNQITASQVRDEFEELFDNLIANLPKERETSVKNPVPVRLTDGKKFIDTITTIMGGGRARSAFVNSEGFERSAVLNENDEILLADRDMLAGYQIADKDDSGEVKYWGFTTLTNWYILRESSNTYRYVKGDVSTYATSWTNRADLTYNYFHEVFA